MTDRLTILIVEDSPHSFFATNSWLGDLGYRVLAQATSLAEAEAVINRDQPRVLLMDLELESDEPLDQLPRRLKASADFLVALKRANPLLTILVHSAAVKIRPEIVAIFLHAGISYLVKEAVMDAQHLDFSIRLALRGTAVYDRHVVRHFDAIVPLRDGSDLSPREWEVAGLIGQLTQKEIAHRLKLSPDYVNEIVKNIYQKLELNRQAQVAQWYQRQIDLGNIPPSPER